MPELNANGDEIIVTTARIPTTRRGRQTLDVRIEDDFDSIFNAPPLRTNEDEADTNTIANRVRGLATEDDFRIAFNDLSRGDLVWHIPYGSKKSTSIGKVAPDGKVYLYGTEELAPINECILIPYVGGWFKIDDKRIVTDYISGNPLLMDSKILRGQVVYKVYKNIDRKGKFFDTHYTDIHPGDMSRFGKRLPTIIVKGVVSYIEMGLLLNPNFQSRYKEDLNTGSFMKITELPFFDKTESKRYYRKHKGTFGEFGNHCTIAKIPTTYVGTYGKQYTFGIEIETCSGNLPPYLDNFLFYSAVHDGSLRDEEDGEVYGGEYVTDVLWGDEGLRQTKALSRQLSARCMVNKKCSVHVHLGDVVFNKENVVLMYYLYQMFQDEIFSIMPGSRRNNEYCRKLPEVQINLKNILIDRQFWIDKYYGEIISVLSRKDYANKTVNKKKDHPQGFKCGYDHSAARYCWVNFIPAVFDTRKNGQYTIEFRPMSATTDFKKIKNWLLICMGLVDVVENHKRFIYESKLIDLESAITESYPKGHKDLVEFINSRKVKFANKYNENAELNEVENVMEF